jgi:hypothetical protein
LSAGLLGLAITTTASAIPRFDSQALFAANEDVSPRATGIANSEWSEAFAKADTSRRNVTPGNRAERADSRSLRLWKHGRRTVKGLSNTPVVDGGDALVTTLTTPLVEELTTPTPVPDSGGTTAALLSGALLGLAMLRRRGARTLAVTQ